MIKCLTQNLFLVADRQSTFYSTYTAILGDDGINHFLFKPDAKSKCFPIRKSWDTPWGNTVEWRTGNKFQIFFSHLSFVSCIQLLGHCLICEWKMFSYHLFWNTTTKVRILTQSSVQPTPHVKGSSPLHVHNTNGSIHSIFRKLPCLPWPDYVIIPFWPVSLAKTTEWNLTLKTREIYMWWHDL